MISDLILIAKKFSVPSAYGRRDGVRDFFAQYPDGVYIATDSGAPAGWEGYAVWFGGTGERYAERFMELIRDGYIVERFLRARVGGLLVFTFRCRLKMRRFGTLGRPNTPEDLDAKYLNFRMPNGGDITLTKTGSPTPVTLEYLLEGSSTWTTWTESNNVRTLTLTAGQKVYIRNASETSTRFSMSDNNYYNFSFTDDCYADGPTDSLLCKNYEDAIITSDCYNRLYVNASKLLSPSKVPKEVIAYECYNRMFESTAIIETPLLPAKIIPEYGYYCMFYNCNNLAKVITNMINITASYCISGWLSFVAASGNLYCPASLTIPIGNSGIPTGWTRHDLSELNQ